MTFTPGILDLAPDYVQEYLLNHLPPARLYHNFDHALEVAETCARFAKKAGMTDEESEILQLAAWFHDCGYAENPELVAEGSETVARRFLSAYQYPAEKTEEVVSLIRSIHAEKPPSDKLEKLLHDANYSLVGRKRFFRRGRLLRLEQEEMEGKSYSIHQWNQVLFKMLVDHRFYTSVAQNSFSKRRNINIASQRDQVLRAYKNETQKKTGKNFGRGVDTLYRLTLRNHIDLSSIADGKANMIISINTLVLSILITAGTALFSFESINLRANIHYAIPVLMLMLSSLTAIIFAVLSAMPKVSSEEFDEQAVKDHKVSLLFFGNFLQLSKSRFVQHLRKLKTNQELLYDDLSRDLYNLGGVLETKYRLLTLAYRVFVGGLVLSFLVLIGLLFI